MQKFQAIRADGHGSFLSAGSRWFIGTFGLRGLFCLQFDLFRRLNTREDYPGTGTGLALCHRLITQQSGTIRMRSALGDGTTVTVTLPTPMPGEPR